MRDQAGSGGVLTPPQRHALEILEHAGRPLRPGEFAVAAWPDSPGWRWHRCGPKGVVKGRMLVMSAGAVLARLRRAGLVREEYQWDRWERRNRFVGYVLTRSGERALERARNVSNELTPGMELALVRLADLAELGTDGWVSAASVGAPQSVLQGLVARGLVEVRRRRRTRLYRPTSTGRERAGELRKSGLEDDVLGWQG